MRTGISRRLSVSGLLVALLVASSTYADTIRLRSGTVYEGKVVRERGDRVIVRTDKGLRVIYRKDIESWEKKPWSPKPKRASSRRASPRPAKAEPKRKKPAGPYWIEPMRQVHARFQGRRGTIAQYGDSITITMAFFVPLSMDIQKMPPELAPAHKTMRAYVVRECWRGWKGGSHGNDGGTTAAWGLRGIGGWLQKHNPEIALIMWGTNDSYKGVSHDAYKQNMAQIVDKVLAKGTLPVLYTIPPRGDQAGNPKITRHMEGFVKAVREVAAEKKVPLIDFYQEIMDRQPANFHRTLMGDRLHPSYRDGHKGNFSEESLKQSGYTLRNYLTLRMFAELHKHVLSRKP